MHCRHRRIASIPDLTAKPSVCRLFFPLKSSSVFCSISLMPPLLSWSVLAESFPPSPLPVTPATQPSLCPPPHSWQSSLSSLPCTNFPPFQIRIICILQDLQSTTGGCIGPPHPPLSLSPCHRILPPPPPMSDFSQGRQPRGRSPSTPTPPRPTILCGEPYPCRIAHSHSRFGVVGGPSGHVADVL